VLIDHNKLTLYQISEPLQPVSSATPADPAPFGTDIHGAPLNDPIPDTKVDPATGQVLSVPATGPSALLDAWTVTKPDVTGSVIAKLSAPSQIKSGQKFTYTVSLRNDSDYPLSGTQVRFHVPHEVAFTGTPSALVTVHGDEVVYTLGHLAVGGEQTVEIPVSVPSGARSHELLRARALVHSSTALGVETNVSLTNIR
jgi:uncharacterized repeat protein (TIGR01451 family)